MIVVPTAKRIEIITSIEICLDSQMNMKYMENGGSKAFLTNPKHQDCVS